MLAIVNYYKVNNENVTSTMEAGTGLMLSFVGQQDKAKSVTDILSKVMNFVESF